MSGGSWESFIMPLIFLLLFLVSGRKRKTRQAPPLPIVKKESVVVHKKVLDPVVLPKKDPVVPASKRTSSYEVEKKQRRVPILSKDWDRKSSLQRAFVLSEVLKKVDE